MPKLFPARALAWLAALALALPAHAEIARVEGPVPVGPDSEIFGAAYVQGAGLSVTLSHYGYVEEEYFVSGTAATWRHTASGAVRDAKEYPYVTRIVVRRPADPSRFSGVVHFEPIHPTQGFTSQWMTLDRYLMARGDIYVAAGVGDAGKGNYTYDHQTAPTAQSEVTKWFDPVRYAALDWPDEDGLRYEVMADIGRKLRSTDADNPLRGLAVKAMLVGGWSFTGTLQRVFINEGFHDRARLPDGAPVFDGYLIGVSTQWNEPGYMPLYDDEPIAPMGDPRRDLRSIDAPVIEFLTELEVGMGDGPQAPDRDGETGAHRLYELAGVIHTASLVDPEMAYRDRPNITQLLNRGYPEHQVSGDEVYACPVRQTDVPEAALVRAAVDNLRHWVLDGTSPPRSEPLEIAGTTFARDDAGNVRGGIRAAEFEVPLAQYGVYPGDDKPACVAAKGYPLFLRNPLAHDDLIRRYGTRERFLDLYDGATDRLVAGRWLLPEDALLLKARARERSSEQF